MVEMWVETSCVQGKIYISNLYVCLHSVTGKFGGIFASMPIPMVGAVFCIMFAYLGTHFSVLFSQFYSIC